MDSPLVSIIVPSYNQGVFIAETLDSILSQDYRPLEVIVMDGASTDDTPRVLERYRGVPEMRIRSEPDDGVVDAVNKGLRDARGDILAIQSSDDTYLPGAITAAVEFMIAQPRTALAFGNVEHIDEHSTVIGRDDLAPFDLAEYVGRLTYIPQASAFFRAEAARAIGGWRAEVSYAPDADYWLRMAQRFPVARIDRTLARYRYHPGQRDKHADRILRDWELMIANQVRSQAMTDRLRRFARMGVHLARYRYAPKEQWALRTLHLYRAALANPASVMHMHFPRRDLFPARAPLWAFLSRVKRALGFRPRGSR